jgi:Nuclear pore protein 84 / 107
MSWYVCVCEQEDQCTDVLEAYVKLLISQKHVDLVAVYVATLPQALQVPWYATFLEGNF